MLPKSQTGYSLLELLIVVVILVVLAGIGYPLYQDQVRKARRTEVIATRLRGMCGPEDPLGILLSGRFRELVQQFGRLTQEALDQFGQCLTIATDDIERVAQSRLVEIAIGLWGG